ncbi:MAG: MATE family efflux transporter [Clostridiales bacterium]|nr:MATE family efflux transporter [Clostridiales bacterium]
MNSDFSEGKVWRRIVEQAVPLTLAQLVQLLYNVIDRIYIGHLPGAGSLALTGVGLAFPFATFITACAQLFSSGAVPLFSIARGAGKEKRASKILGNAMSMILVISVAVFFVCYRFREPLLYLFGASDETIGYASSYLQIYLFGVLFSLIGTGMNGFINAQGYPKTAMLSTVIGAVINLILDPILIFGLGLGVRGAAAASVIGQFVSASWILHFLTGRKALFTIQFQNMIPDFSIMKETLSLGIAGFVQQMTNCLVQIVCNATLKTYGGDTYVGIMTILNSVREIASLPIVGLTGGAQPVLGYNYGAKEYERVRSGIRFAAVTGILYTTFFWAMVLLFPSVFIRMFSSDASLLVPGIHALHLYFFGFCFMSLQFVGQYTFIALGKAKQAVFFSLFRKVVLVVPLTILLPMLTSLGTDGVFIAEPISNFFGGLASFGTMWFTVYRRLGKAERES